MISRIAKTGFLILLALVVTAGAQAETFEAVHDGAVRAKPTVSGDVFDQVIQLCSPESSYESGQAVNENLSLYPEGASAGTKLCKERIARREAKAQRDLNNWRTTAEKFAGALPIIEAIEAKIDAIGAAAAKAMPDGGKLDFARFCGTDLPNLSAPLLDIKNNIGELPEQVRSYFPMGGISSLSTMREASTADAYIRELSSQYCSCDKDQRACLDEERALTRLVFLRDRGFKQMTEMFKSDLKIAQDHVIRAEESMRDFYRRKGVVYQWLDSHQWLYHHDLVKSGRALIEDVDGPKPLTANEVGCSATACKSSHYSRTIKD